MQNNDIRKGFYEVLINSLNTVQINYLGGQIDSSFNVYDQSGFTNNVPLPQRNAAQVLLNYFASDEEIVNLFTIMLENEGDFFKDRILRVRNRSPFIKLLAKYKWIYDPDFNMFFLDPFYENEINLLKKLKVIDLRKDPDIDGIMDSISTLSRSMDTKDLDWRITIRLYDLERKTGELLRKIIELLLKKQELHSYTFELFTCLKELTINATKANYKILFEKHITKKNQITAENDYEHFMRLFRTEIEENGNRQLIELARKDDRFISIVFQSDSDSIGMHVTNNQSVTPIEKRRLLQKVGILRHRFRDFDEEYTEGAGLGLEMVLNILRQYSDDKRPMKIIFYPDYLKIGFMLKRDKLEK